MHNNGVLKKMVELRPTIIPVIITYFEVVGLFGNINLIIATIRKKHLRTKHGVLLALTTFYQSICLLGEIVNFFAETHGGFLRQDFCFYIMIPYIWFCCMQSTMFLILSLDTLFSVLFPLKHMVCRLWMYVSIASIPPILYAALIITMNSIEIIYGEMHNHTALICNPMLSMDHRVADFWINWNGFSNLAVLAIYMFIYAHIMKNEKQQKELGRVKKGATDKQEEQRKRGVSTRSVSEHYVTHQSPTRKQSETRHHFPLRKSHSLTSISTQIKKAAEKKRALISLLWLVAIFTSTWCTCMLSQVIASWMAPSDLTVFLESYAIIFAMMAYSVNYYVYFARNRSYRMVFLEQLSFLLPKRYQNATVWNRATQSYGSVHVTAHAPSMLTPNFKGKYGIGGIANARGDHIRPSARYETGRMNSARTETIRQLGCRLDPVRKISADVEYAQDRDIVAMRKISAPVQHLRTISE